MEEKKITTLTEEELARLAGGEDLDVSKYTEEELARIFDLYLDMYGEAGALSYLSSWGVTSGDYYLMTHPRYWMNTPYYGASRGWRLAHLVYLRKHR